MIAARRRRRPPRPRQLFPRRERQSRGRGQAPPLVKRLRRGSVPLSVPRRTGCAQRTTDRCRGRSGIDIRRAPGPTRWLQELEAQRRMGQRPCRATPWSALDAPARDHRSSRATAAILCAAVCLRRRLERLGPRVGMGLWSPRGWLRTRCRLPQAARNRPASPWPGCRALRSPHGCSCN